MFPGNLGPPELLIIMLVAVLVFGKRLPEVGRSLGKGIIEFKKGLRGDDDEFSSSTSGPPARQTDLAPDSLQGDYAVPKFEVPRSSGQTEPTEAQPPYQA